MRSAGPWKAALFIAGWTLCGYASEPPQPGEITFAHLTDAHIFDDGYKKASADAMRQAANDRDALHWAIDQINAIDAGTPLDFVVYTGDLGLQNVSFPSDDSCGALTLKLDPLTPPTTLDWAVKEIAGELNRLQVGTVLFVAGNNDIQDERATDRRFDCFMTALKQKVATLPRPLRVMSLGLDQAVIVNGVRIAGLNTASFKLAENYEAACAPSHPRLPQGCPEPQMKALHALAASNPQSPLLLFTHVPDLIDPHALQSPGPYASVWKIPPGVHAAWEQEVCGPNVLAVFAGHFHEPDRKVYGSNTSSAALASTPCVAKKTWVAPPLALKYQDTAPETARGFLIAKVAKGKVADVTPHWFEGSPPPSPAAWPKLVSWLWAHPGGIAWAVVVGVVLLLGAILGRGWLVQSGYWSRDLDALIAAGVSILFALMIVWFSRSELQATDSATIVALLLCPLLVYGVVSGRLTEFSGPGGWGAKFEKAARSPVELSSPIDVGGALHIPKAGLVETLRKIGQIQTSDPVVLTLTLGRPEAQRNFTTPDVTEALRSLSAHPNFKFAVFLDPAGRMISYILGRRLLSEMESGSSRSENLLAAANRGDADAVSRGVPDMRTDSIPPGTTNAEALKKMDDLNLDAIPVVDPATGALKGIVERDRILAKMFLSLSRP